MEHIIKYFPHLSANQQAAIETMLRLYPEWNERINVISRKDIDNLEVNHVLHSLSIAKFLPMTPGTRVLDMGTGGGFPGIPLAALMPDVQFHLLDRIGKKLRVAQDVAEHAGLQNVTFQHGDIKEVKGTFDFVVSRAVMPLGELVPLVKRLITSQGRNAMPNGLICLKGGDLQAELRPFEKRVIVDDLSNYFSEPYFKEKKIIYLPLHR